MFLVLLHKSTSTMCSMAVLTPQSKRPITKAKLWYLVKPTLLHLDQVQRRRRQWHPTPVLLPGKSHGWRSLVGCSPWGHEESDTPERLHFHFSLSCIGEGNGNYSSVLVWRIPGTGGAWWATVYGVAQSRTQLKRLSSSSRYKGKTILHCISFQHF